MDRIKGQDIAIKATAKLIQKFPKLKLILVGDGSFSGSQKGGLSHPKAIQWRLKLEQLTRDFGIEKRVVFTGYIPDGLLKAAYKRCDIFVLPSIKEGFGIVVPEAWIYKKPVVISKGAGASELVIEGVNGYTFEPGNADELAEKMKFVLLSSKAEEMGERGSETARTCYLEEGMKKVYEVLEKTIEEFRRKPT
jgi:glycosyltransferase involved in cell wall biosynthesis